MSRPCMACELQFEGEGWLARWWEHIRSAEHEAQYRTPEGRTRIAAYWAAKDAERADAEREASGMLPGMGTFR